MNGEQETRNFIEVAAGQKDGGAAALTQVSTGWNPRFVAYAAMYGRTPEAQLDHDRVKFPGGCMAGFIAMMGKLWASWDKTHGHQPHHMRTEAEHRDFDAWLATIVEANK